MSRNLDAKLETMTPAERETNLYFRRLESSLTMEDVLARRPKTPVLILESGEIIVSGCVDSPNFELETAKARISYQSRLTGDPVERAELYRQWCELESRKALVTQF